MAASRRVGEASRPMPRPESPQPPEHGSDAPRSLSSLWMRPSTAQGFGLRELLPRFDDDPRGGDQPPSRKPGIGPGGAGPESLATPILRFQWAWCCTKCYTVVVPTRFPRHSITETPTVHEALDELRSRGERVHLGELVVLGARERLRELDERREQGDRNLDLRRQLVEQLHTGDGLDAGAAYEVREHGWSH